MGAMGGQLRHGLHESGRGGMMGAMGGGGMGCMNQGGLGPAGTYLPTCEAAIGNTARVHVS